MQVLKSGTPCSKGITWHKILLIIIIIFIFLMITVECYDGKNDKKERGGHFETAKCMLEYCALKGYLQIH
jgi:hypothetical protein